jgi:cold shock CspA family protein
MNSENDLVIARVKWFGGYNRKKGKKNDFGFAESERGFDVLIHASILDTTLHENQIVLLKIEQGDRGYIASECRLNPSQNNMGLLLDLIPSLTGDDSYSIPFKDAVISEIVSNLSLKSVKTFSTLDLINLLNSAYATDIKGVRSSIPWASFGYVGLKLPRLIEILNMALSDTSINNLDPDLEKYLSDLPPAILCGLDCFNDLIQLDLYRKHFDTLFHDISITIPDVAVNLIKHGFREPKEFFYNSDIVLKIIKLSEKEEPPETATIFMSLLEEYLRSIHYDELCKFLEGIPLYKHSIQFRESVIIPIIIDSVVQQGEDFSLHPDHVLSVSSNLNYKTIESLDSEEFFQVLRKVFNSVIDGARDIIPWAGGEKTSSLNSKLIELINARISASELKAKDNKLLQYLCMLPPSILTGINHFEEFITTSTFRESFVRQFNELPIEDSVVAINLIKYGFRTEKDFFNNPIIINGLLESSLDADPPDVAISFAKSLRADLSSRSFEDLTTYITGIQSENLSDEFLASIITSERIYKALEQNEDITKLDSNIVKSHVDTIDSYVRANLSSESIHPLLQYLSVESVIDLYFTHGIKSNVILARSDVRSRINTFLSDPSSEDIPENIKPFLINHNSSDQSIVEYFQSPGIPDLFKELQGPKIALSLLFQKNELSRWMYENGYAGENNLKNFILFNLLPLLLHNSHDTAYTIFVQRLWDRLKTTNLELDASLMKLFPSCGTVYGRPDLSCEAVYWQKADIYLCRGKPCSHPKIIPNLNKSIDSFTMFDWLKHYGIDYLIPNKPKKADFAHKLGGYFNKIKDIADRLICRECDELLIPNFKYSRTKYNEFDIRKRRVVEREMAAAYRVTVFRCANRSCSEFEHDIYISHCIGFNCDGIIDARDLTKRCDRGLYVCDICGSCCYQHSRRDEDSAYTQNQGPPDDNIPPLDVYDDY